MLYVRLFILFLSTLLVLQSVLLHLPTVPRLPLFPLCAKCSREPTQGALIQGGFLGLPYVSPGVCAVALQ